MQETKKSSEREQVEYDSEKLISVNGHNEIRRYLAEQIVQLLKWNDFHMNSQPKQALENIETVIFIAQSVGIVHSNVINDGDINITVRKIHHTGDRYGK